GQPLTEPEMLDVADDPDDLSRGGLRLAGFDDQSFADGVNAREVLRGQRLVDDDHRAIFRDLLPGEVAAPEQRDANRREIPVTDATDVGVVLLTGHERPAALNREVGVIELPAHREF